jgi:hypothetical protein
MKPTIKPHQTPTFHRDGTVSWFSISKIPGNAST